MTTNELHLRAIARESHAKLSGLAVEKNCWCGVGIGDPRLSGKHDEQCREIRRFMKRLEHTIKSVEHEQERTES